MNLKKLRLIKYFFFNLIYGKIKNVISAKNSRFIKIQKINFKPSNKYFIYKLKKGRLFSNSVNDAAYLVNNCLVSGPSYQFRIDNKMRVINGKIKENIVLKYGTPKICKKIQSNVFSLLTGGAGKNNYWHWLFDVLPRIAIYEKSKFKKKNDLFLFPSLSKSYQRESIFNLNISEEKLLDGEKNKHFISENLLATDHPTVIKNNPSRSVENIPHWIIKWLTKKYSKKLKHSKNFPKKIFISRENDSNLNLRRIINSQEVESYLKNNGFTIVSLGENSFEKQINYFYNAKIIMGLHGAGFANMIFSKAKTRIIEIRSSKNGKAIMNLAENCGLKYSNIIETNINPNLKHQNSHIKVDIRKIRILFTKLKIN